jgi:hypothetical protein
MCPDIEQEFCEFAEDGRILMRRGVAEAGGEEEGLRVTVALRQAC